jgi:TonB family protein
VWSGPSRRRVPRFHVQAPLDVTVLRSGIPDTVPGRSVNMCERGLAAVVARELVPGEAVGIEVQLPLAQDPLRTRAVVRYQDKLRCGLEFVGLSAEQRAAIRDWVKEAKAEAVGETSANAVATVETRTTEKAREEKIITVKSSSEFLRSKGSGGGGGRFRKRKNRRRMWAVVLGLVVIAGAVFWWRWNRGWEELESGLRTDPTTATEKPVQVPAEVMEKLLTHRVEPVYPVEARESKLEGIIALDIVVGQDGSVESMRPLNGPGVLARAAMDALRWWRFEPYRVNGEPMVVETTVAVEFKR